MSSLLAFSISAIEPDHLERIQLFFIFPVFELMFFQGWKRFIDAFIDLIPQIKTEFWHGPG